MSVLQVMGGYWLLVSELGEFGLIERLRKIVARSDERMLVGIGDDASVLEYHRPVVATTDALVENVHFRADLIDEVSLGYKALSASLSDVAAMGAKPLHALITLFLSGSTQVETCERIYQGLKEAGDEFGVSIAGGDVVKSPLAFAISVTVLGELVGERPLLRSGAKAGDLVFVTGDLGGSAAYLHYKGVPETVILSPLEEWELAMRHRRPIPQVVAGAVLAGIVDCTSANDISDGLASELNEIATASQVRMVIEAQRIPTMPTLRRYARMIGVDPLDFALFGGEDYQLVGTVTSRGAGELLTRLEAVGVKVTLIGRVEEGNPGLDMIREGIRDTVERRGFDHFSSESLAERPHE